MTTESWELRLGEERAVRLPPLEPPAAWTSEVGGMQSAVTVIPRWTSDPAFDPDDPDEAEDAAARRAMVFAVRGTAPGRATIRFTPTGPGSLPEPRSIDVTVER
jgi:hypothetical protein